MPDHIPSAELTLDQIPDPESASQSELWTFCHTYHAYTVWGGVMEACKACEEAPDELDRVRCDVFMVLRAARHQDVMNPPVFWEDIREAVKHIRRLVNLRV